MAQLTLVHAAPRPNHDVLEDLAAIIWEADPGTFQHYVAALASVGQIDAVLAALRDREAQRLRLQEQLAALDAARTKARQPYSRSALRKDLRRRMDDWRRLLCRQTPVARQILTKLINGRLVFTAHPDEQLYRFTGMATLGHLLAGLVVVGGPVAIRGAVSQGFLRPCRFARRIEPEEDAGLPPPDHL